MLSELGSAMPLGAVTLGAVTLSTVALSTVALGTVALGTVPAALGVFRRLQITNFDVFLFFCHNYLCCFGLLVVCVMSLAPNNN